MGSLDFPLFLKLDKPPPYHASPGHGPLRPEHDPVMKLGSTQPEIPKEKNPLDQLRRLKHKVPRKAAVAVPYISSVPLAILISPFPALSHFQESDLKKNNISRGSHAVPCLFTPAS